MNAAVAHGRGRAGNATAATIIVVVGENMKRKMIRPGGWNGRKHGKAVRRGGSDGQIET